MLLAAPYTNDTRWRDIPDEYNLKYTSTSTSSKLVDFCKIFKNKRVNVMFLDRDIDFTSLELAAREHDDIAVRLMGYQFNQIQNLKDINIKFFFDENTIPCYSFGVLETLINLGVSDIYIYDNLCYNMNKVKEKCKQNNIKTRLVVNCIPSVDPDKGAKYTSPIFCPRDMEELEQYIDVIEFDCIDTNNVYDWHYFNVLRKAWFEKHDWNGDLREINKDLTFHFPHDCYYHGSFDRRFNCGRACTFDSKCTHCQIIVELAQSLYEKGAMIMS